MVITTCRTVLCLSIINLAVRSVNAGPGFVQLNCNFIKLVPYVWWGMMNGERVQLATTTARDAFNWSS